MSGGGGRRAERGSGEGSGTDPWTVSVKRREDNGVEYDSSISLLEQLLRQRDDVRRSGGLLSMFQLLLEVPLKPFKFSSMRLNVSVQAGWCHYSEAAAEDGTVINNRQLGPYPLERTTKVEMAFIDASFPYLKFFQAADIFTLTGIVLPPEIWTDSDQDIGGWVPLDVAEELLREVSAVEQARSDYLASIMTFDPKQSFKAQMTLRPTDLRAPMGASTPSVVQETYMPFSFLLTGVAVSVQAGKDYKCEVTTPNQYMRYPGAADDMQVDDGAESQTHGTLPLEFVTSFAISVKRIGRGHPDRFHFLNQEEMREVTKLQIPAEYWENSVDRMRGVYVPAAFVEAILQSLAVAEADGAKHA